MVKKDSHPHWGETGLPPGVKLRHTLRGHEGWIGRIAWSPDGRLLSSPSADSTIRLWDIAAGGLDHTLEGHTGPVISTAWSPEGRLLASSSDDSTIKIWKATRGTMYLRKTLQSHGRGMKTVAWSPDGKRLASVWVQGIQIWDIYSGQSEHIVVTHDDVATSIAWSPDGRWIASASMETMSLLRDKVTHQKLFYQRFELGCTCVAWSPIGDGYRLASAGPDHTIALLDFHRFTEGLRTTNLEGHTASVQCLDFLFDGRLLASKAANEIRLWRCDTWETVATIPEYESHFWLAGLAFHPALPVLATVGSGRPDDEIHDNVIRIWDLDLDILLGETFSQTSQTAVHHTTAKIVLVGDSGVGKTGLGWRLAHGKFKEHASTHGQQFWVLDELGCTRKDGTQCEAVLWDLAGQTDYRLIHALFLDDADLALVVFDPTDSRDPMHGVDFWLKQWNVARSLTAGDDDASTILVGARLDRGSPTVTDDEIDAFCQQRGVRGGYVGTSAKDGEGLESLLEVMRSQIDWGSKTRIVTTQTFKRIRDYVLSLKEDDQKTGVVVDFAELRGLLKSTDPEWSFTDDEMTTAVRNLGNYGFVRAIRTSTGSERVVLKPELINNLASSFVLEARRNPKGLGTLEEDALLEGRYPFRELDELTDDEQAVLLDAVALQFLEHNIAFRETDPLSGRAYLIFPELINLKKPDLEDEKPTEDTVSYTVVGAVENVYSSLVVLLGYTDRFTRTNQWHNQARYEVGDGLVSGFRQSADRNGELEFVLYFGTDVGKPVRTLFQGLFESLLARRNLTVRRFDPLACPKCGTRQQPSVVRERRDAGHDFAFCYGCGQRLELPRDDEPIQLTQDQRREVDEQRRTADLRTRFEQALFHVRSYADEEELRRPLCFISYAWGDPEQERWVEKRLAQDLQKAGLQVLLDRWHNAQIGANVARFIEKIPTCEDIVVVGTPGYLAKHKNEVSEAGSVAAAEMDLINQRMTGPENSKASVRPLLLEGDPKTSLPPLLRGRVYADCRKAEKYFPSIFDLILSIYGIPFTDQAVAELREGLLERF